MVKKKKTEFECLECGKRWMVFGDPDEMLWWPHCPRCSSVGDAIAPVELMEDEPRRSDI